MKRKNKGFTLVELLVVLAIMGLVLIMIFPAVNHLIKQNDNKKYLNYEQIVLESAKVYYNQNQIDLIGGTDWTGCYDITKDEMETSKLLKEFGKGVSCDVKVRVTKENNQETFTPYISCTKENSIEYQTEGYKTLGSCPTPTVSSSSRTLDVVLFDESRIGEGCSVIQKDYTTYLNGNCENNYVWYSGKLWRVISRSNTNVVKMVTQWNIAVLPYSKINTWLNDSTFDGFLNSQSLDSTYRNGNVVSLSENDYTNTGGNAGFLKNNYSFSITSGQNFKMVHHTGIVQNISSKAYGVRPVITLKIKTTIATGAGTIDNPYRFTKEKIATDTLLNTRYSGEYLKFNNELYRIVSFDQNQRTKIVKADFLSEKQKFGTSSTDTKYSTTSGIGKYLNETWYNTLTTASKKMMVEGPWYLGTVNATGDYRLAKCTTTACTTKATSVSAKVGLPRIGELFSGSITQKNENIDSSYFTVTPFDSSKMNCIYTSTGEGHSCYADSEYYVRPMLYLNSNVKIASGTGLPNDPFVLTQ